MPRPILREEARVLEWRLGFLFWQEKSQKKEKGVCFGFLESLVPRVEGKGKKEDFGFGFEKKKIV